MKKATLMLLGAAIFAGCARTTTPVPTTSTSTAGTSASWTVDGKKHSADASNITINGNILTALEKSTGATFVINSGPYPFPAKDDSFLISDLGKMPYNGNSLYVQVTMLAIPAMTSKTYVSVHRGLLKYASIIVNGGKVSVTIPEIWVYNLSSSATAGDSLKMSGTISQ